VAAPAPHPIRLVVADDLQRSRLTVFFRLLLAIPHFIWAALFGVAATFVAFLSWWAALFSGRTPRGMHGFMAGFVRYLVQVEGYVFLAANPYPPFYVGDVSKTYPVDVEIDPPAPQRRPVTFFRLLLAIPALVISSALGASGGAGGGNAYYRVGASVGGVAAMAAFLTWFAALVRGRAPRGLRDLAAWGIGYGAQMGGYLFLLTDRYPNSDPRVHLASVGVLELPPMPATGVVSDDLRRSRLTVFFRLLLWVPHLVWFLLWTALAWLVGILNWLSALFAGRSPRPFARFLSAYVRYAVHQNAFLFLVGNPFPGFVGKPGSYPIDLELDPFHPQRRLTVLFRLFLWLPSFAVSSAAGGVLFIGAILGWFYALVRGRMPEGLRNAGAWAVTYSGQANAYLFLLSDRYPFSSPLAVRWAA
jgi:Domain of unknown function (DUF4389)